MVKRIIPGNMSPWECEINDVKYVYPPGTEQMVPDEVAHVIDAWYASQEPKYPEPVQPEGGGGSGGGAQPDWNAAEGEPGHILNRPCWKEETVELLPPTDITASADMGGIAPIPFTEGLVVEVGRTYEVSLAVGDLSNTVLVEAVLYEQDGMEMGAILPIDDTMQIAVALPELGAQEGISGVVMGIPEGVTYTIGIAAPGDVKTLDEDMIPEPPFFDISSIGTITKNGVSGNVDRGIYRALGKGPVKIRYLYTAYDGTIKDNVSIVTATRDNTSTKTFSFCIPLYEISRISILHIWCNPEGLVEGRVNYLLKDG